MRQRHWEKLVDAFVKEIRVYAKDQIEIDFLRESIHQFPKPTFGWLVSIFKFICPIIQ